MNRWARKLRLERVQAAAEAITKQLRARRRDLTNLPEGCEYYLEESTAAFKQLRYLKRLALRAS